MIAQRDQGRSRGRLVRRRAPVAGESLHGLVAALRARNYAEEPGWWRDYVLSGARCLNGLRDAGDARRLARAAWLDVDGLMALTAHRFVPAYYTPGARAHLATLEPTHPIPLWDRGEIATFMVSEQPPWTRKVCPTCWRVRPTPQIVWAMRQVVTCPEHGDMLVDRCDGCGRPLALDIAKGLCRYCGRVAVDMTPVSLAGDPDALALGQLIGEALDPKPVLTGSIPEVVQGVESASVLRFLWWFGDLAARRDPDHPLFTDGSGPHDVRSYDVARILAMQTYAWRMLQEWPARWHAALVRIARREWEQRMAPYYFPRVFFARLGYADPAYGWLVAAWDRFLYDHTGRTPGVLPWYRWDATREDRGPHRPRRLLSFATAIEASGIGPQRLDAYITAGQLAVREERVSGGANVYRLVETEALDTIRRAEAAAITAQQAAEILGLSPTVLLRLADAGLIETDRGPRGERIHTRAALGRSLGRIAGHLPIQPMPRGRQSREAVRWRVVQALLRERGGRLDELLAAVRDGVLPAYRARPDTLDIGSLWWERAAITRYVEAQFSEAGDSPYTTAEVCQVLGCRMAVLRRWCRAGFLIPLDDGAESRYDRGAVQAFKARYRTLTETAAILGVHKGTVQEWADRGQLLNARVYRSPARMGHLFDADALKRVTDTVLTADQAADVLGIKRKEFNKMVARGQIAAMNGTRRERVYWRDDVLRLRRPPRRIVGTLPGPTVVAAEAYAFLGVSRMTFNRWVARGDIRPVDGAERTGRRYRAADIVALARRHGLVGISSLAV